LYGDKSNKQAPSNQSKSKYSAQTDIDYPRPTTQSDPGLQTAVAVVVVAHQFLTVEGNGGDLVEVV